MNKTELSSAISSDASGLSSRLSMTASCGLTRYDTRRICRHWV
ncbi:hypothetical protein [Ruminococcus albus]|nr:hypothetical protein [Ruminococcus albus]